MTNTVQNHTDWADCFLNCEAELEELDRQAEHEYVPMDVFVDARTIEEHFRVSSIRDRWNQIHPAST